MSKVAYTKTHSNTMTYYEVMGVDWDRNSTSVTIETDDKRYVFTGLFEKKGQLYAFGLVEEDK